MINKRILLLVLLAAIISMTAFGQASAINGQIVGTVTDSTGAPIAAAKVTAENSNTGFMQTAETEASG